MKISQSKCKRKQVRELMDAIFWLVVMLWVMIYTLVTTPSFRRQVSSIYFLGLFLVLFVCKVVLVRFLAKRVCLQHRREKQKLKEKYYPGDFEPPTEWIGCRVPRPQAPPTLFAAAKVKPEEN